MKPPMKIMLDKVSKWPMVTIEYKLSCPEQEVVITELKDRIKVLCDLLKEAEELLGAYKNDDYDESALIADLAWRIAKARKDCQ